MGAREVLPERESRLASPGEKIRTDHLQAVPTGQVATQHKRGGFERLIDDNQPAVVCLERKHIPFLSGNFTISQTRRDRRVSV